MNSQLKIAVIGAGNISNTRHIPALKKQKNIEIYGVVGNKKRNVYRTIKTHKIPNSLLIDAGEYESAMRASDWFTAVDAVVVGAPPQEHYDLVSAALKNGKHVLVEKPMTMSKEEAASLIKLSRQKNLILFVMHNFQYAQKMLKLNEIIASNKYGKVISITESQFTNHDRRLPEWYNNLPFGLFYDEAAHFLYLLERHAGKVEIKNSYAVYDNDKDAQTPKTLMVGAQAGEVPVSMLLNFHAPICEWHYVVCFEKRILMYDFFKDILIDLPTDNEHFAKDILSNSFRYTFQYWSQFIGNGFKLVLGNLLYGHDVVMNKFMHAIRTGEVDESLTADNGMANVSSIHEIVNKANRRT